MILDTFTQYNIYTESHFVADCIANKLTEYIATKIARADHFQVILKITLVK